MTNMDRQIAARLESCFAASGFTEPGVDALRDAAGVSLRTLYKYYPSREEMVLAALEHRHRAYLAFLDEQAPGETGLDAVRHLFRRVGAWMKAHAPRGCLFVGALTAHPGNARIMSQLVSHKNDTRAAIAGRIGDRDDAEAVADQLMVLHEGLTSLAVSAGADAATEATLAAVDTLLAEEEG